MDRNEPLREALRRLLDVLDATEAADERARPAEAEYQAAIADARAAVGEG